MKPGLPFNRDNMLRKLGEVAEWDVLVIGGGATGLGIALDAASRGYDTLLLEQHDFAKGTSSRSTKLIHGGVRYLAQGNIRLVYSALRERGLLLKNAPHLVTPQPFIIPCYSIASCVKYYTGLKLYDLLAGTLNIKRSAFISRSGIAQAMPRLSQKGLKGGVKYFDARFDDTRLAINIAQTAAEHSAVILNYFQVESVVKTEGKITGVIATDVETGLAYELRSRAVINATGVFVDDVLQLDDPQHEPLVRPSQGIHLVVRNDFLENGNALLIPKTSDGRVLFAVPWHNHLLIGTTDTPVEAHALEPKPLDHEISFILETLKQYLNDPPSAGDVLSLFAGLRPLAVVSRAAQATREIPRDHKLVVSESGLITITGGKWTTYRKMAEETVGKAILVAALEPAKCLTRNIALHGSDGGGAGSGPLALYGSDAEHIKQLALNNRSMKIPLVTGFEHTVAEVVWAVRHEMARTIEDVLARRIRLLFLDARAAMEAAPLVAGIMAEELGRDAMWQQKQLSAFHELAGRYCLSS